MQHYKKRVQCRYHISCSTTHFVNFVNFFGHCQVQTFRKKNSVYGQTTHSSTLLFLYCYKQPSMYSMAIQVFRHLGCAIPWSKVWIASGIVGFLGILVNATVPHWKVLFPIPVSGILWTSCECYGHLEYGIWFPKVICLSQGSVFAAYILNFTWAVRFWER